MTDLHVQRWGHGPEVLLVHGGVLNGEMLWSEQRPLAERWTLVVPDRRGFWPNPPIEWEDFDVDAGDIADLLGDGMHLVGHSYGGLVALLAAARRPEAVRSLTVIEPPAFDLVRDHPAIAPWLAQAKAYWETGPRDPAAFLQGFGELISERGNLPNPLPPPLLRHARLLLVERPFWEARIPVDELRAASFPKLVVSGGQSAAVFHPMCDALEQGIGAQRATIPGVGHTVPRIGGLFNDRLEQFLREAEVTLAQRRSV